jgi:hypothetical protein
MTKSSKRFTPSPARPRAPGGALRGEPELGALLRRANEQYAEGLDEAAAYRRLEEQLTPLSGRGRGSFGAAHAGAFLGALALAGALVWLKGSGEVGTSIVLGPEERARTAALAAPPARWSEETPSSEAATVSDTAALAVPPAIRDRNVVARELRPEPKRDEPKRDEPKRDEPKREIVRQEQPSRVSPSEEQPSKGSEKNARAEPTAEAEPEPTARARAPELDCMQMARDGAPREAETCFATLASGVGLRAEMALHEMARLRRDVLGDASGALAALSEYRQRFPRGSLRHEVALSRVELLVRLGRARDALRESEELLTSPDGRIRAAELHVLRGNMYRTALSDLNAAAAEFARAERLGGPLGAEATYLRGTCLEALGDARAALEAYERYMSTPRRPRAVEVRRRIAALSVASPASEQAP